MGCGLGTTQKLSGPLGRQFAHGLEALQNLLKLPRQFFVQYSVLGEGLEGDVGILDEVASGVGERVEASAERLCVRSCAELLNERCKVGDVAGYLEDLAGKGI